MWWNRTHGMCSSGEYRSYHAAKQRCRNKRSTHYAYYGGRGIQFKFKDFEQFYSCIGSKPTKKHTLDRINTNGHYAPDNVRWATRSEQVKNRRKSYPKVRYGKGYHWHSSRKRWVVAMFIKGKYTYIGSFTNEKDALKVSKETRIRVLGKKGKRGI